MRRILSILTLALILLTLTACGATKGSIVIIENMNGSGCEINFSEWTDQNKCELSLNKNDELQVEIVCESGDIALSICGENGQNAYSGNGLETGVFTVTVFEADTYMIGIAGKSATGSIAIQSLSGKP